MSNQGVVNIGRLSVVQVLEALRRAEIDISRAMEVSFDVSTIGHAVRSFILSIGFGALPTTDVADTVTLVQQALGNGNLYYYRQNNRKSPTPEEAIVYFMENRCIDANAPLLQAV